MYNAEQKIRYLNTIPDEKHRNLIERYFNDIQQHESMCQRDLCNMTVHEILLYYRLRCTSSLEMLMVINYAFANYVDWCLGQGLVYDSQNHFREITNSLLINCINTGLHKKKIFSRQEILSICKSTQNPVDAYVILGLFEGICGRNFRELYFVSPENLHGNVLTLCTGRELEISNELKEYFLQACSTYEFRKMNLETGEEKMTVALDENWPGPIKNMASTTSYFTDPAKASDSLIRQRVRGKVDRMKIICDLDVFTTKGIREAGRIDMIKRLRRSDESVDETIQRCLSEIEGRYGEIASIRRYLLKYKEVIEKE